MLDAVSIQDFEKHVSCIIVGFKLKLTAGAIFLLREEIGKVDKEKGKSEQSKSKKRGEGNRENLVIYIPIKRLERSVISSFNGYVLHDSWLHDIHHFTGIRQ